MRSITGAQITGAVAVLAMLAVLAGCGPSEGGSVEPTPSGSASPTPSATSVPQSEPRVFAMPVDCASLLPASRLTAFEDAGLTLLGGPGGKYGTSYLADPTPEERAGGITCIWGDGTTDQSATTVSVAPLVSNRAAVVQSLIDQGLNEAIEGDLTLYAVQGDEDRAPAILNVLRPDSWISVIQTTGGPVAFEDALVISDEVALVVYR